MEQCKLPRAILESTGIKNKPFSLYKSFKIKLSNGDTMIISKGYWTDFASVPRLFKAFIDHEAPDREAFIVHDYLYNFRGYKITTKEKPRVTNSVTRKFADREMKYQMNVYGAIKLRQFVFYWALRLFGWLRFGKI